MDKLYRFDQILSNQLSEFLLSHNIYVPFYVFLKSIFSFNTRYVRELQKLQDEVGTFDNDIAYDIIKTDLKLNDVSELFEFDPKYPIASASIGQVYRGRLITTNQLVAVKVQRPDAIENASLDMFILRNLAIFFKRWKKLNSDMVVGMMKI